MSNLGIAGFKEYREILTKEISAKDWETYFETMFYHKGTQEQIDMFKNFILGIEVDAEKVINFCSEEISVENIPQKQ